MSDERLRELERCAANDSSARQRLEREYERTGKTADAAAVREEAIRNLRALLLRDPENPEARAEIERRDPYAWTGFITIEREPDTTILTTYEGGTRTFSRSFATRGRAHVLSCGKSFFVIDDEKEITIGEQSRVRPRAHCVPVTCTDHYAAAEAYPSCGTRKVSCSHAVWVGGDAPLRFLDRFRGVSVFHVEGQIILNVTGTSDHPSPLLAGNVVIEDQKVYYEIPGNWREYNDPTSLEQTVLNLRSTPLCIPKTSRLAIPNNRAGGPSDLISAHTDRGDTLLVEAPVTTLNKLRQLPEHYAPRKTGAWQWENP